MLAITGETSTYIFGRGGLQESSGEGGAIDQAELFRGITRYRKLVERTDYVGQVLNQVTQALYAPQPGPVLLSIPYNVQKEMVDETVLEQVHFPTPVAGDVGQPAAVGELVRMIESAERPVIIAGYGCVRGGGHAVLACISERLNIPVTSSLKANGAIDERSALSLGSLGVASGGSYRATAEHDPAG